jgi:hypothetical protein
LTTVSWPSDRQPQQPHLKQAAIASVVSPALAVAVTLLGNQVSLHNTRFLDFLIFLPLAAGAACGIWTILHARNWGMRRIGVLGTVICVPYAIMMLLVMLLGLR